MESSVLTKSQARTFGPKPLTYHGTPATITATVRHDDRCNNGVNTFSITGEITATKGRELAGGCLHEKIARHFPELAPLLKWHLTSTDGPWGYVANTVYFAGDRDCHGLRKGETRQIRFGGKEPCWQLAVVNETGDVVGYPKDHCHGERPADPGLRLEWRPHNRIGEGKDRELDKARDAAVWPDATDEELSAAPEVLKAALLARLPALMVEFRAAVESLGFTY